MDTMRKKCNRAAFRLSKLLDVDVKEIHGKFKPQREMTEPELQSKLDQLVRECNKVNDERVKRSRERPIVSVND